MDLPRLQAQIVSLKENVGSSRVLKHLSQLEKGLETHLSILYVEVLLEIVLAHWGNNPKKHLNKQARAPSNYPGFTISHWIFTPVDDTVLNK